MKLCSNDNHYTMAATTHACSIDDFNTKFYNKSKTGKHLKLNTSSLSYQNHTPLWPLIAFLLRLVYPITILKKLHILSLPYSMTHIECLLIHHLPKNDFHYTADKSVESIELDGQPSYLLASMQ